MRESRRVAATVWRRRVLIRPSGEGRGDRRVTGVGEDEAGRKGAWDEEGERERGKTRECRGSWLYMLHAAASRLTDNVSQVGVLGGRRRCAL